MAMSPAELRRRRMNMLMAMSYSSFSSSRATPAFALLVNEAQGLALDFTTDTYLMRKLAPIGDYAGKATSFITFSRSSAATRINQSGVIETVAANTPRLDYDPVTRAPKGLLIESQKTNLLLNTEALATQDVTVTAAAHTLSFYGTGTVTLSGVSTAGPLVGTGSFPNRVSLTFTPTAGTLTLTVSGSVTQAQLETGSYASSYMPSTGTPGTRMADIAQISTASFPYSSTGSSLIAQCNLPVLGGHIFSLDDGTTANRTYLSTGALASGAVTAAGVLDFSQSVGALTVNTTFKTALAYELNNANVATNGAIGTDDTAVNLPAAATRILLGTNTPNTAFLNGYLQQLTYLPRRLSNSALQNRTI